MCFCIANGKLMLALCILWSAPALLLYQGCIGYKESFQVSYNYSPRMTISLFFLIIRFNLIRVGIYL
jgi:hypothetical protein